MAFIDARSRDIGHSLSGKRIRFEQFGVVNQAA